MSRVQISLDTVATVPLHVAAVAAKRRAKPKGGGVKDDEIRFRVPSEEKAAFQRAADADSRTLSDWLRVIAKKAAGLLDVK